MIEEMRTVGTDDGAMGVFVVRPDTTPDGDAARPGIVSFHHGPGLDEGSKEAMRRIASWGFVVASHDRYHRDGKWLQLAMRSEDEAERRRSFEVFLAATDERVAADLEAVIGLLDADPGVAQGPMGCIGYCIGARSVLRALGAHPDRFGAGVALHPSRCTTDEPDSPHLLVPTLQAALYVGFGADDTAQPPADNQALIDLVAALPGGEVEVHEGAVHGFAVPGGAYHEAAADRSYSRAEALFAALG